MRSSLLSSNNNKRERERRREIFVSFLLLCSCGILIRHAGSHFFFHFCGKKTFEKLSFFRNFALHIFSSLRWISTVPITRAFIGASLLSTHCLADTQREIFSRFSNNIIIEYNKNERDGQIVVERGGDHHY